MQHPSNGTPRPETYRLPGFGIGDSMVTITLDADTAQKLRDALSEAHAFVPDCFYAPTPTAYLGWTHAVNPGDAAGSPAFHPEGWRVSGGVDALLATINKYGPQRMAETDAGRYLVRCGTLIRNGEYYERAPRD